MLSRWKRTRYRLEWLGLSLATKLIPLFSRRACYRLAQIAGALLSFVDRRRYHVALSNLEVALGNQLSARERRKIARASFQHFARTMVDLLWSPRLTPLNFLWYIELKNFEETMRDTGPERSMIIACYHYSNFEWLSLACGFLELKGTIISQEFKNSSLDPIFKKLREQSGHELIPRERGIIRLYKVLRRKGRTALLVDLTVPPSHGAVAIDCFGLKTSVTSAHVWLNERTGVPIIPAHCEPLPNGRYRLIFHPKINATGGMSHQEIAQACWNSFEPYVRKNPAPWLWMYKHWRYLPANADQPYPFYANFYRPFEDMLEPETAGSVTEGNEGDED
ncbi:MAG TPA: lysophospholipid acyltransferase family protein [Candidatus Udaeobacter sp.]|jgi:KDO2-lipid IV(A) lauroyltransferase|nr:lysophospholipid acyltransferase family protein [Candidatus Udaeobacter sp.]